MVLYSRSVWSVPVGPLGGAGWSLVRVAVCGLAAQAGMVPRDTPVRRPSRRRRRVGTTTGMQPSWCWCRRRAGRRRCGATGTLDGLVPPVRLEATVGIATASASAKTTSLARRAAHCSSTRRLCGSAGSSRRLCRWVGRAFRVFRAAVGNYTRCAICRVLLCWLFSSSSGGRW